MIKWNEILENWESGNAHSYPKILKYRFMWNTSVIKNNGNCYFYQKFKGEKSLPSIQNTTSFHDHIFKSKTKYATSFPNLSGDTILVIPMPMKGKNFPTIKDFIDNSDEIQQIYFWKKVANETKKMMKKFDKIWVSTSGLGVPYCHVRICTKPKYYFDNKLKQE
jgi:hypothetical protein